MASDPASIDPALAGRKVYGLIWTTTPWTIPANMAIAFQPEVRVRRQSMSRATVYIVAADLVKVTAEKLRLAGLPTARHFPGARARGLGIPPSAAGARFAGYCGGSRYAGTGHGRGPHRSGAWPGGLRVGQKYGIPTYCPVDAAGRFFHAEGAPGHLPDELIGKTVWEANPIVLENPAGSAARCSGMEKIAHSYPHCWRCHNPVIFRATEQWFIGMERNNFRQNALDAIKQVKWMPAWGQERISNMIAMRPDWCISRQRVWGVPIIVFYCESAASR